MFAALVIVAGLCAGCGKADKSEPEGHRAHDGHDHRGHDCGETHKSESAAAEQPKKDNATKWEPEIVPPPKANKADDGHDHSGHDHSGHDH